METKRMIYILIGPRSVGKSTVGKILAKKLKMKYFDFDEFVENKLDGIDNYIEKSGIESYRKKESTLLKEVFSNLPNDAIISLGGGTIASQFQKLNKENIKQIKKKSKIIYLSPSDNKEDAIKILSKNEKSRKGNKTLEDTKKLFELRRQIYENLSEVTIITKNKKPNQIVKEIIGKLK